MSELTTRVHTILFTEACPLACRYCYLKDQMSYKTAPNLTFEQVLEMVKKYDEQDDPTIYRTNLLFTGGEPFLYWDWIKAIIDIYGDRFSYSFNTSGYCFTEEIIRYLSKLKSVDFVLSIDGTEKLTNYLRPLRDDPLQVGYFKKLKEILPTLLYYFPKTPYRIIINPRYVDMVHECYLEAEKLGFKYFTCILDFETRPGDTRNNKKAWSDEDTVKLQEQFNLIAEEIIYGFVHDISRPIIIEMEKVIKFLFNQKEFSPKNLPCALFAGRSTATMYKPNDLSAHCMGSIYPDLNDCEKALMEAYKETNGVCNKDNQCPAFEYCALHCCPKVSLTYFDKFFEFDTLECIINKIIYRISISILDICNQVCPTSRTYLKYLNTFKYPGKEDAIHGLNLS